MTSPWLIVAGDFRPNGGMDKANYHLAWRLVERHGVEVRLVAHRVAEPLASHPRVRARIVPRPWGRHALAGLLLDRTGRSEARRLIAEHPDGRVVVNGGNCLWHDVNWVHMVHHAAPPPSAAAPPLSRLKSAIAGWLARRSERAALTRSRIVIANSEQTRGHLISRLGLRPERVHTVYLGVEAERFAPRTSEQRRAARSGLGLDDATPVGLFVGALGHDRNKGFDTLLAAWARLNLSVSPLLLAVGAGELTFWRRQADALGIESRVRLLGPVERIEDVMAAADLMVSPTRYDAYGLAVHEALCRGLPAIVTRAAGVAERYPPELSDLLLDDPDDVAALAERLRHGWANLDDYRRRVAPFGEALRAHDCVAMAEQFIRVVSEAGVA